MLKNKYFLKKNVKIASASEIPPPNPRLPMEAWCSASRPPRCHSRYFSFAEFVSSAKCVLLTSKKKKVAKKIAKK